MGLFPKILLTAALLLSTSAFAIEGDLVIKEGAYFKGLFHRLVCTGFEEEGIATPSALAASNIQFQELYGDRMTIFFSINANFQQDDSSCRYSALFTRGARNTLVRSESKAFALDGTSDCQTGKAEVDALLTGKLAFNYTTPINFVSLKLTSPTAAEVCGAEAKSFKLVFERIRAPK